MQLKITTDYAIRIVYYLACRSEVITASWFEIKPVYDETTGKLTSYSVDYTYNGKTTNGAAITNKTDSPEVAVENKTGAQLPSTGSKGALMVTLAGIVLFGALTASKAFGKKKANN